MPEVLDDVLLDSGTHYTELRTVLFGSFNLSQSRIPYMQTVFTLKEVVDSLQLVEAMPSDLRAKWSFEELFQREIDWDRVKHDLLDGYLKQPNKLKFFNSLTVALLPLSPERMLDSKYGETPNPPALTGANASVYKTIDIGGVQIVRREGTHVGYVRWDVKRIFAATIDGQHRLAALKQLADQGSLSQAQLDTSIAVTLLVMDQRAGLVIDQANYAQGDNPLLRIVREIFIDLNKHTKEIVRSREILLDDQSIEAVCVRSLLAKRIGDDSTTELPLGLVHWQHKVTAKFNTGQPTAPFITTVELLNLIMQDFLDLERPKDPLDEPSVRKFIDSIEDVLQLSKHIEKHPLRYKDMKSLTSYAEVHNFKDGYEEPFVNPPMRYVRAAADAFTEKWKSLFIKIFLNFKPYKSFIDEVRKLGGIDGDIAFYMTLPERQQKTQRDVWGEHIAEHLYNPLEKLASMKLQDWPFYAVFQKGLFRATKTAALHKDVIPSKKRETPFADLWLTFLNEMFDRGLFAVKAKNEDVPIWVGISVNSEGLTVKWSDAAVGRIAALILLWWYFWVNDSSRTGNFLKKVGEGFSSVQYPGAKDALKPLTSGLKPVLRAGDKEVGDKEMTKRIDARLRMLIGLAKSKTSVEEPEAEQNSEGTTEAAIKSADAESES